MAANPVPVINPCHLVILANGRLGADAVVGTAMKVWILRAESVAVHGDRIG